jgi:hypothetical protein
MKKLLSTIVAALVALSFTGIARAVPASDEMNKSISVLENEDQGSTKKPVKKQTKKPKKAHKQHNAVKKPAGPAPSEAPAGPTSTAAPATAPVSK